MKIRSITYFANPGCPINDDIINQAATFIPELRLAYENTGYEVQTIRFATPPFPSLLTEIKLNTALTWTKKLEEKVLSIGFDYLSIGPALPEIPESYQFIPKIIEETDNCFASGIIARHSSGVSLFSIKACADIIKKLSMQRRDGLTNLYFAALANVHPGAPFFPAAYHDGKAPFFSIATEAADLAVQTFNSSSSLIEAQKSLIQALEYHANRIVKVAEEFNIKFGGIDFSLAPYPAEQASLGTAMERLGFLKVGNHGSLTAAAFIADIIDKAKFPHTGFSGMMLPVLEDYTLARRAAEGILSIKDLLLYSAVCGTGLDTVPLPGDVSIEKLSSLLMDLGTLAMRLNKPLTARLMPIQGKVAGDATSFDFPYFTNSRIMSIEAEHLEGILAGDENFRVGVRSQQ